MNVFSRMGNIFTAPEKAFISIRDNKTDWADYVLPLILLIAVALIFTTLTADITREIQVNTIEKMQSLSDAQKQDAIDRMNSPMAKTFQIISVGLMVPVSALLTALIFLGLGNFIGGGKQTFGKMLASALLIQLISIPESILKLILALQKGSVQVYLGLGSFFNNPDLSSFGFQFAAQFEFFKIWRIIVWIVAFKVLYKYSGKKATLLIGIVMLIGMLISALAATSQAGKFM